jgi:hypothetical protein
MRWVGRLCRHGNTFTIHVEEHEEGFESIADVFKAAATCLEFAGFPDPTHDFPLITPAMAKKIEV